MNTSATKIAKILTQLGIRHAIDSAVGAVPMELQTAIYRNPDGKPHVKVGIMEKPMTGTSVLALVAVRPCRIPADHPKNHCIAGTSAQTTGKNV